eukprot:12911943-Prorocentrum_lima.AAC.1
MVMDGPHDGSTRTQWKPLFSPIIDAEVCPFPRSYHHSSFEWELQRRLKTFCGIPWNGLPSFEIMK